MKQQVGCASALALLALAAHGEPAPSAAPPVAAVKTAEVSDPSTSAQRDDTAAAHWWTFNDDALLEGLGLDPEAGTFRLGHWQTTLDLHGTGHVQETESDQSTNQKLFSYVTTEGITVRNSGWYLLDPRLLTGTASVRFGFQQARQDASSVETAQDGDVTDYYFDALLFSEKPLNAMLQASHSEFATAQAGGSTTGTAHSLQGATLSLREASLLRDKEIAPYFSATLFAGQEDLDETTTNAGQQFRRAEHRKDIRFDAHNGFETGDLSVAFDQTDLTNEAYPSGSYRSRNAELSYGMDFGKTLSKHSDLHVNYNERTGSSATDMLDVQENLFFEHNSFLSSNYGYLLQEVDSVEGDSTVQRLDASMQYLPFMNVSTDIGATASRSEYLSGTIESLGGHAGVSYSHWLPAGGALTASVSGSLTYTDSQLASGNVPVVDEPHQAPTQLGAGAGFLLNNTDVLADTIIIVDVRGGARLPTVEGVDYEVEVEGDRTKIVPLATSAVIQGGDPLEVSYQYLVDPSLESRIDDRSYFLSADWQWIAVALTHDVSIQEPLSGQESTLLGNQKRTMLRVDLRRDWGNWRARGNARAARYRDTSLDYDEIRFGENLSWQPSYDWELNLDANQTESRFLDTGRVSRYFDGRLGGSWHSVRGWWTDGYLSWRTKKDSESATETINEAFVRVRRNWPRLAFTASLGVGTRERDSVRTTYENILINLTRTF